MKNPFVFLAVSLPILAACSPSGGASESADEASGPYKTATVEVGDVRDVVPAVGSLEAVGQVEVRAATTGTVTKVLVGLNDTVSEGQALAELRDPNEAADVRAARANADAAKARVDEANAAMRQIETELRNKSSLEKAGINSPAALEKLRLQLDAAKAAVERSEAEGRSAEALYDAAAAKAKLYVIASPSAGAVVGISLRSGQTVSPGDTAPAFLIGNTLDTMQVIALIPESDVHRIKPDMSVIVRADAFGKTRFFAKLEKLDSTPTKNGRFVSYPAIITVQNRGKMLFSGMTASVELIRADALSTLRIPVAALYYKPRDYLAKLPQDLIDTFKGDGLDLSEPGAVNAAEAGYLRGKGLARVFVMQDDQWARREVKIGMQTDDYVEVTEGLLPGDVVITGDTKPQM